VNDPTNRNGPASRERFLSLLNDITYAALETENLDDLMQLLADRLSEIINADGSYLTVWDEASETVIPVAAYGPLRDEYRSLAPNPGEPTITELVLKQGKPIVIEDLWNTSLAPKRVTHRLPAKSMLAIPIFSGSRKVGAALISFDQDHKFTDQEVEYCEQAVRQIGLAIVNQQNITALRESEENYRLTADALKRSEAHLAEAQENAKIGSWEFELGTRRLLWSSGLYRLFDIEPDRAPPVRENLLALVHEQDREEFGETLDHAAETLELQQLKVRTISGRHLVGEMFYDESRDLLTGNMRDVTEERRLEAELLQARKMEAVGTLAGGIAHNFNNILTVIKGNYEMLKSSTIEGSPERSMLNRCLDAADRAAALTRQLLVVSRKHDLSPTELDVNELAGTLAELLKPLIGSHIATTTNLAPNLARVHADQGHLEQVIMNLMLNARDALEQGGKLRLTTKNIDKEGQRLISIEVSDDGPGIPAEILPHIFDPFFTTKDEGKGTGLGLATVASIVEQSGGYVTVESEPQSGARFTIHLPALEPSAATKIDAIKSDDEASVPAQNVKILLVEDNESLRSLAQFILEQAKYTVVAVRDGIEALAASEHQSFDLLLTDVQLPQNISGPKIASQLQEQQPDLAVIFMSGLRESLPKQDNQIFLPKPFRPNELLSVVSKLLASQRPRVSE
jgi:signal transduction histidine kinase